MKTIDLKTSKIMIGQNILLSISSDIKALYPNSKVLIITDDNVSQLYLKKLTAQFHTQDISFDSIIFDSGERTKNFSNIQSICEVAADMNLNRGDIILALGGGVIGDLAGFAASIFLRGLKFISVPTTLLAQVDSSVGGKTGINIAQGKNLVGCFYKADRVYVDVETLKTLDDTEFKCGMAEVIKYGLIWDKKLYDTLMSYKSSEDFMQNVEDIVFRCCEIKAKVVHEDEFDKGLRMILNYGHTIGHAIENTYGYGEFSHGQAIAIGMVMMTRKSEDMSLTKKGTTKQVIKILENYGLDTELDGMDKKKILDAMSKDKKNIGNVMNIIILDEIGKTKIHTIDPKEMVNFI